MFVYLYVFNIYCRYSYRFKKMYMERLYSLKDYDEMLERKGVIRPQPRYSDNREDAMHVGMLI